MKKKYVINLFAGPGSGKSTSCAGIFRLMKLKGLDVELVTEYAKDVVWEQNYTQLSDQIYIFAQQHRRVSRIFDHDIDIVVTDSPIIMGATYISKDYYSNLLPLMVEVWNSYENINFFINRPPKYVSTGRTQTHEEAIEKDNEIKKLLSDYNIPYTIVDRDDPNLCENIVDQVINHIVRLNSDLGNV